MNILSIILIALCLAEAAAIAGILLKTRLQSSRLRGQLITMELSNAELQQLLNRLRDPEPNAEVFNEGMSQSFEASIKKFSMFTDKAKATFLYRFISSMDSAMVEKTIQYGQAKLQSIARKSS